MTQDTIGSDTVPVFRNARHLPGADDTATGIYVTIPGRITIGRSYDWGVHVVGYLRGDPVYRESIRAPRVRDEKALDGLGRPGAMVPTDIPEAALEGAIADAVAAVKRPRYHVEVELVGGARIRIPGGGVVPGSWYDYARSGIWNELSYGPDPLDLTEDEVRRTRRDAVAAVVVQVRVDGTRSDMERFGRPG